MTKGGRHSVSYVLEEKCKQLEKSRQLQSWHLILKFIDLVLLEVLVLQTLCLASPSSPPCSPAHGANLLTFLRWITCFIREVQLWHCPLTLASSQVPPTFILRCETGYLIAFRAVFLNSALALMFSTSIIQACPFSGGIFPLVRSLPVSVDFLVSLGHHSHNDTCAINIMTS